jgi:hypothetical protein
MKPDIDLMQYADGELDPAERAELEAEVARDPVASTKLRALGESSELVRSHLELAADEPGVEARLGRMWTEIEKGIEREAPIAAKVPPQVSKGLWARITRWVDTYRGHVLTGALSAGAVAGIALILRPSPAENKQPVVAEGSGVLPTVGPDPVPAPEPMILTGAPAEVESLEVPGGTGTVFTIEGEDGEETTVIWVTPDDTLEGI